MKNEFVFEGAVKWPPTLKTTANGNPLLPLTLEQDKASISMVLFQDCLLYTSPSPRDRTRSRMPSSA